MSIDGQVIRDLASAIGGTAAKRETKSVTKATVVGNGLVVMDGASMATEVAESTVEAAVGDTVLVTIEDGTATVTGNVSQPAQTASTVQATVEPVAQAASEAADAVARVEQHFWADDAGAHVSETADTSGKNVLIDSGGMHVFYRGCTDGENEIAHLGYGFGNDEQGGTSESPYYTLGTRMNRDASSNGNWSFVAGVRNVASGHASFAGGTQCIAVGSTSIAIGTTCRAVGHHSQATGMETIASGLGSSTSGFRTTAEGENSHAEGISSKSVGDSSHAEGMYCKATASASHAQNISTIADCEAMTAIGKYNTAESGMAFSIGNGTASNARSDALTVSWDGDLTLAGHDSPIGTVLEASDATWTVPSSIGANLIPSGAKVTCGAGTWVITADVTFPSGAGRNRSAGPSVDGNLQSYNRVNCYDTAAGHLTATTIRTSATAFTAGVCIGCSATTTSKGNAWVKAVRIA